MADFIIERKPTRTIALVQILRFYAAAVVLLSHIQDRVGPIAAKFHTHAWDRQLGFNGRFGVDIFFVISGFIMGWIGLKGFAQPGAPRNFLVDRVTRIVPLYWLCTLITLAVALLLAHFGNADSADKISLGGLLKSLAFIPFLNEEGKHRPFLGQGWTLDHEMMFYAIFTVCLLLRKTWGIALMVVAFVAFYIVGMIPAAPDVLQIWGDPIIFEFLIGFGLCLLYQRYQVSLVVPFAWTVPLLAILLATAAYGDWPGLKLERALTASAIVAFAIFAVEGRPTPLLDKLLARLGDSSYALYLTHGLVLLFVGIVWRKLFHGHLMWGYAAVNLVLALGLGYLAHIYLELPVTRMTRALVVKLGLTNKPSLTAEVRPADATGKPGEVSAA